MKEAFTFLLIFSIFSFKLNSQNLDIDILHSINNVNHKGWDKTNQVFSSSVTPLSIAIPAGLLLYGLAKNDSLSKRNAIVTGAGIATCGVVTFSMKYSFNRPRPFTTYPDLINKKSSAGSPSFPSGHTSAAFATATSLSLLYPKWYIIGPSFLWAGAVGYSRMELGVHYPSDVLVGALIGVGSSFLMWKMNQKIR